MEPGVYTFGDVRPDPRSGSMRSPQQRLADLIEEAELAEQVGLDVFGVGEHHRPDYAVSSPATVLAAVAARGLHGAVAVGSPEQVAEKILFQHEIFGHQRFLLQASLGGLPHREVLRSIELFGTEVAPLIRAEVAERTTAAA